MGLEKSNKTRKNLCLFMGFVYAFEVLKSYSKVFLFFFFAFYVVGYCQRFKSSCVLLVEVINGP